MSTAFSLCLKHRIFLSGFFIMNRVLELFYIHQIFVFTKLTVSEEHLLFPNLVAVLITTAFEIFLDFFSLCLRNF